MVQGEEGLGVHTRPLHVVHTVHLVMVMVMVNDHWSWSWSKSWSHQAEAPDPAQSGPQLVSRTIGLYNQAYQLEVLQKVSPFQLVADVST